MPVLAERFARERLRAYAQSEGRLAKDRPEIVFVSLTGGGRAQIGAALLAQRAGDAVVVHSAGSDAWTDIDVNGGVPKLGARSDKSAIYRQDTILGSRQHQKVQHGS